MNSGEIRWLKRTVLIGLGGTGKEALLRVKKRYIETFGEVPPLIKFLLIDTTSASTESTSAVDPTLKKQNVRLKPHEVMLIEARGASRLPKTHPEIREWFPRKADLKSNIIAGAGQIRALGRLALFANAQTVYEGLRALLSQARDYVAERPKPDQRYVYRPYSPHLTVCVITSLAGGTGSGIFLDVAMILRDILKDEDQLFGYLLLPDIYVQRPGTQNVEANAYGALRELDYYMSQRETHRYQFGGREIELRKKPFDMVFLVNNRNRAGKTFNKIEEMAELLGFGAFLISGPLGKNQADVFDNIVMQLTEQQSAFSGKQAHYASFGAAELRFQPMVVDAEHAAHAAKEVLEKLFSPSESETWPTTELEIKLSEVLNPNILPNEPPKDFALPDPSRSRQEDELKWENALSVLQHLADQIADTGRENLKPGLQQFEDALKKNLDEAFRTYSAEAILGGLKRLREQAETLAREREKESKSEAQQNKDRAERFASGLKISRASRLQDFLLRREPEPKVTRKRLEQEVQTAITLGKKRACAEAARNLCGIIQARIEALEKAKATSEKWRTDFVSRLNAHQSASRLSPGPFTVILPPPYLSSSVQSTQGDAEFARDTEKRLREKGLIAFCENPEAVLEEVFEIGTRATLKEYLKEICKRSDNDREAVERELRELNELSEPAWDYQEAWLANPQVSRRELVSILGIEDRHDSQHPLLRDEFRYIFASNIEAEKRMALVSTGDERNVYLYKIEASIPAFTLQDIEMYRERYRQLSQLRSFHVNRVFENDGMPDLMPLPSEKEAYEVWTKAQVLKLIRRDGARSCFERKGEDEAGKEKWYALGSSIAQAFGRFREEFFDFVETSDLVRRQEEERCRTRLEELQRTVQEATEYCKRLIDPPGSGTGNGNGHDRQELSAADREVVRRQIEILEQWLRKLNEYEPPREYALPSLSDDGAEPHLNRR